MDPNEILKAIREKSDEASRGVNVRRNEREIRWEFGKLDEWITSGGRFPDAWGGTE